MYLRKLIREMVNGARQLQPPKDMFQLYYITVELIFQLVEVDTSLQGETKLWQSSSFLNDNVVASIRTIFGVLPQWLHVNPSM